jgi:predicted Zn-dependent protease
MLFENGRLDEATTAYRESVRLKPESALLRVGLAQTLIETGEEGANAEAISLLEEAVRLEHDNAGAWRLLGIAEGRAGNQGDSAIALAEYALLAGREDDARLYLQRARKQVRPGDPSWLHLEDLSQAVEQEWAN